LLESLLRYLVRTSRFSLVENRGSETILVFVHGIASRTESAFQDRNGNGFFWDRIKDRPPFKDCDIGVFSYGRWDLAYLLEMEHPFNNFERISHEMHGFLDGYKNVIFIAHSQGGLLAKQYSCEFYNKQGVFLTTLHTPHRNKSLLVMPFVDNTLWNDEISFKVPHLFCGSINDNAIVRPDNALTGCRDSRYISRDISKKALGHSHLSASPDPELIDLLQDTAFYFINSGLNRQLPNPGGRAKDGAKKRVRLIFSRSLRKLKAIKIVDGELLLSNPWKLGLFASTHVRSRRDFSRSATVTFHGCSVDHFLRVASNRRFDKYCRFEIESIDKTEPETIHKIGDILCEGVFEERKLGKNPYSTLPFDVNDFRKRGLIRNRDFLEVFTKILRQANFTIPDYVNVGGKARLNEFYRDAIGSYRDSLVKNIYAECLLAPDVGPIEFDRAVARFVHKFGSLHDKRQPYPVVYETIKRCFLASNQPMPIRSVECLVSRLMRSDGHLYWLDRDVPAVFQERDSINFKKNARLKRGEFESE
jgi:hypothetical protein